MRRLELPFRINVQNREGFRNVANDIKAVNKEAQAAEERIKRMAGAAASGGRSGGGSGLSPREQLADLFGNMDRMRGQLDGMRQQTAELDRAGQRLSGTWLTFGGVLKGLAIGTLIDQLKDLGAYAARTETLVNVSENLARTNHINVQGLRAQAQAVKDYGITTQETLSTINKMIPAQLDLRRATDLARVAQDSAVIANKTSSETLEGLVLGITTRNSKVLRTYGILVDFEREYAKETKALGRELTNTEKVQTAFNLVLEKGALIAGTYESSMLTTSKQMATLTRHIDEAKNSLGRGFIPILGATVRELTSMAKWFERNGDEVSGFITGVGGAAAGLGVAGGISSILTAAGRAPLPLYARVLAIGAGYLAGRELAPTELDNIPQAAQSGFESIARRSQVIQRQLKQTTDPKMREQLAEQLKAIPTSIDRLVSAAADAYAETILRQAEKELKDGKKGTSLDGSIRPTDRRNAAMKRAAEILGSGVRIGPNQTLTADQVQKAIEDRLSSPNIDGPLLNQALLDQDRNEELARQRGEEAKKTLQDVNRWITQVQDVALTEMERLFLDLDTMEKQAKSLGPATVAKVRQFGMSAALRIVAREVDANYAKGAQNQVFSPEALARGMQISGLNTGELERLVLTGRGIGTAFQATPGESPASLQLEQAAAAAAGEQERTQRNRQIEVTSLREMADLMSRKAAAQGDEVAGLAESLAIRHRILSLEQEIGQSGRTALEYQIEQLKLQEEAEIRILEIRKQQRQQAKEDGGRLYDALTASGNGGLQAFFRTQLNAIPRKLSQNVFAEVVSGTQGMFEIPGQYKDGKQTALGRVLDQVPFFGADPAKQLQSATVSNTVATNLNSVELAKLRALIAGGGVAGPGGAGGMVFDSIGSLGGTLGIPRGVFQGADAGSMVFSLLGGKNTLSSGADPWSKDTLGSLRESVASATGGAANVSRQSASLSNLTKGLAVAGGAVGVYSGLKQGGAQGGLMAASSGLATAAALDPEPISKTVLMAAAAITGVAASLIGNPKEKFARRIEDTLNSNKFTPADSILQEIDAATGRPVDYNSRGEARVNVTVNVTAMDSRSFIDHSADIAAATARAISEPGPLRDEIRNLMN